MRTPASYLREIAMLRAEHSQHFAVFDFEKMPNVQKRIVGAWAAYATAVDRVIGLGRCVSCGKPADPQHTANRTKPDQDLTFCSAECKQGFGILLGTT